MLHMIGNAHIDPVWLWRWQEGYQEVKATFRSALDRMDETGEFVFTAACADYYRWVRDNAPDMFDEIKRRVREGRWRVVGGMWVQPDCNMPSGESFARHLLYSQRFFREELGVTARTGYNVDSFGHCATLPALLTRAGIENYVFLRPGAHENPDIPYPLFRWIAPDGSAVNAFRIIDAYTSSYGSVQADIERALAIAEERGYPVMCFYGVGNHGGGPTIQNIESLRAYQRDGSRGGEVVFSDPDAYFAEVARRGTALPEWRGELQHHASGCYSATSLIKRLNRRTENALLRCETLGALARRLTGHSMGSLRQAWQNLMFNQFHDVLCGCAIREAYDDARLQLGEAASIAAREENAALQRISWNIDTVRGDMERVRTKESHSVRWEHAGRGTPIVVFNPHAFEAEAPVQIMGRAARITNDSGATLPCQTVRASRTNGEDKWDCLFTVRVPALGYKLCWAYMEAYEPADSDARGAAPDGAELAIDEHSIGNRRITARFDPDTGALISLVHRASGRDVISAPALPRLVDIEHVDTWAHGVFKFDKLREAFGEARFSVLERGPVRARLRVETRALASKLTLYYTLYAEADQLEVEAVLDMREDFRILKLCFPVACTDPVARAEIPYGFIERKPDGCEETGHRWMALCGADGGLAVLNDGKYSFSAIDGELRLTAANTSIYADHYGQATRDDMCQHADIGLQRFKYALVPIDGDWRQARLQRRGELFNMELPHVTETYHAGPLPPEYSGLRVSADNVSIGAVKRAEDGDGWILRVTESAGLETDATIDAPMFGQSARLRLKPLDIRTLFLPDDAEAPVEERMLTEWACDDR